MNKKQEIILNKKILLRLLFSVLLAFITNIGIYHTGKIEPSEDSSSFRLNRITYGLKTVGGLEHYKTRQPYEWSNEENQAYFRIGWGSPGQVVGEFGVSSGIYEYINTPSYIEKLRYFYIPITFKYWYILIATTVVYYGVIYFFNTYKLSVK
jgi:hypothetical protein